MTGHTVNYRESERCELAALRRENDELRATLDRRAAIEQAKGALMLRFGLDERAAFAVLSRWSQTSNLKLHAVAERLLNGICRERYRGAGDQLPVVQRPARPRIDAPGLVHGRSLDASELGDWGSSA